MSPNLSFERLAIVLALAGCSKATPAADGTSTTVRSDPSAQTDPQQAATPPPPVVAASAVATTAAPSPRGGGPGGAASAIELKKKDHMGGGGGGSTGQASCGAGSCTNEIKKK